MQVDNIKDFEICVRILVVLIPQRPGSVTWKAGGDPDLSPLLELQEHLSVLYCGLISNIFFKERITQLR